MMYVILACNRESHSPHSISLGPALRPARVRARRPTAYSAVAEVHRFVRRAVNAASNREARSSEVSRPMAMFTTYMYKDYLKRTARAPDATAD